MDSHKAKRQLEELKNLASREDLQDSIKSPHPEPTSFIKYDWMNKQVTKEEILSEYMCFLRSFPNFLDTEREKIIESVRSELKISQIEASLSSLKLEDLIGLNESSFILENLSAKLGQSLKYRYEFISPLLIMSSII